MFSSTWFQAGLMLMTTFQILADVTAVRQGCFERDAIHMSVVQNVL